MFANTTMLVTVNKNTDVHPSILKKTVTETNAKEKTVRNDTGNSADMAENVKEKLNVNLNIFHQTKSPSNQHLPISKLYKKHLRS